MAITVMQRLNEAVDKWGLLGEFPECRSLRVKHPLSCPENYGDPPANDDLGFVTPRLEGTRNRRYKRVLGTLAASISARPELPGSLGRPDRSIARSVL